MAYRGWIAMMTLAGSLCVLAAPARAFDESKYPDWKGRWQRPEGERPVWVRPGDKAPLTPEYQALFEWNIADQKVDSYCVTYQANRAEIEAQIPALKELCDLAQMPNAPKKAIKITGGLVTCVFVFSLSGFAAGIIQWLFHLGMNFAHYLTGLL